MWKVVIEMPSPAHGETTEKPTPAPNANSNNVSAADAIPPAITAPQDTVDVSGTSSTSVIATVVIGFRLLRIRVPSSHAQPATTLRVPCAIKNSCGFSVV